MVNLQHTSFSFFPVNIDEQESIHRPTNDVYERYVTYVTSGTYGTNNINVLDMNNIYKCVDFRVAYHETSHTMSCPFETAFCMFQSLFIAVQNFSENQNISASNLIRPVNSPR